MSEYTGIKLETLQGITKRAGSEIMKYYTDDLHVELKGDNSPLTLADLAAHTLIVGELGKADPETPVISEESGVPDYNIRKNWTRFWLVDPLDGTKEFIKRNGEFTVNIALIEHGVPVIGLVYVPATDLMYYAQKGHGAYKQTGDEKPVKIEHRPYVRGNPARIVVSRSHGNDYTDEKLGRLGITVSDKIPRGSSLKFCMVAEGKADLYPRFGPTMEWDTAAADAVYRYSGTPTERTSPLSYNKPDMRNQEFIIGL